MNFRLTELPSSPASASPYRLVDDHNREVPWGNDFLDAQRVRALSLRSLRAYAYDLLHFLRWWSRRLPQQPLSELQESTLVDYIRFQLDSRPQPPRKLSITASLRCAVVTASITPPRFPAAPRQAALSHPLRWATAGDSGGLAPGCG